MFRATVFPAVVYRGRQHGSVRSSSKEVLHPALFIVLELQELYTPIVSMMNMVLDNALQAGRLSASQTIGVALVYCCLHL
jgi:hypothetical protein